MGTRRRWGILARALLFGVWVVQTGCYGYRPIPPTGRPPRGAQVRARLTDDGASSVRLRRGGSGGALQGEVVGWDAEGLHLAVGSRSPLLPTTFGSGVDTVSIPSLDILVLEEKHLDGLRTALLVGGLGVGLGLITVLQFRSAGGGSPAPGAPPGGGDGFVWPALRVTVPW